FEVVALDRRRRETTLRARLVDEAPRERRRAHGRRAARRRARRGRRLGRPAVGIVRRAGPAVADVSTAAYAAVSVLRARVVVIASTRERRSEDESRAYSD